MTQRYIHLVKRHKKVVMCIIVVIITTIVILTYVAWTQQPVIDRRIIREADFPVYAPRTLPEGFAVKREQTQLGDGVLSYVFVSQKTNREITVTVQPKPKQFDMSQMTKGGSIKNVALQAGTLYDLSAGGSSRFLFDTGDTLVFLTSPDLVDMATMTNLANSLDRFN